MIERGTDVATAISETYDGLADLQAEADRRLRTEVDVVNTLTSQIAELNGLITGKEAAGNVAADERDRRDLLMKQLSEKIGIEVVEQADGGALISLPNGFPLVSGSTARPLELTVNPSFSPGTLPPSLSGGTLSYIVYDYSNGAGTTHLDLTQELSQVGGIIGGLLNIRGFNDAANTSAFDATSPLVDVASQVEAITRDILTRLNTTYLGPDREGTTAGHQPSSIALDGNTPGFTHFLPLISQGLVMMMEMDFRMTLGQQRLESIISPAYCSLQ